MDKYLFNNDIVISASGKSIATFKASATENKVTSVKVESNDRVGQIASWGTDNNFPNTILDTVRSNGMTLSGLRVLRKNHYGSGLILVSQSIEEATNGSNKRKIAPVNILEQPEINSFFTKNKINLFFQETIADLETWSIAFPEYILSADYKKINRVYRQQAANCRFEIMDDNGFIKNVWVSHKWNEWVDIKSKYAASIPLISMWWSADEVKEYCKKNKIRNFVRPICFPMLNEAYYPFTDWHAAIKWIELSNTIPDYKKKMFENQANLSFHIEVSEEYFERKYKNDWWEVFDYNKREELKTKFVEELDASISGAQNSGVVVNSIIYKGPDGNPLPSIKITPIDNKLKDGMYLPEASAANSEILSALGLDVSLIGSGIPGGQILNGSGSDKRVAWSILSSMMKSNREYTTDIFNFIKEYNGWDENIFAVFEDATITTLDVNPTGTTKTANI